MINANFPTSLPSLNYNFTRCFFAQNLTCNFYLGFHIWTSTIGSVQNPAAWFILSNYFFTASVAGMKSTLLLSNLSARTYAYFTKFFYHDVLHDLLLSSSSYASRHIDHRHKMKLIFCSPNAFCHSFCHKQLISEIVFLSWWLPFLITCSDQA